MFADVREVVDGFDVIYKGDDVACKDEQESDDAQNTDDVQPDEGICTRREHYERRRPGTLAVKRIKCKLRVASREGTVSRLVNGVDGQTSLSKRCRKRK